MAITRVKKAVNKHHLTISKVNLPRLKSWEVHGQELTKTKLALGKPTA